jgi:spore germination cell wall hydrolase CwlJ-like protein
LAGFWRHQLVGLASFASASCAIILPATMGHAELAPLSSVQTVEPRLIADPESLQGDEVSYTPSALDADQNAPTNSAAVDPELECMAKVVYHEAANQSRKGQLAVAQTLINRANSGRFPSSICGVANQRGQFFSTASYHPPLSSPRWKQALDVSREARDGAADVTNGAYFFHANYVRRSGFFRSREKVASLGDHDFYR